MEITTDVFRAGPLQREEALFHTANGYLGVRGNFEEGYPEGAGTVRGCYINGFYDIVDLHYPEKLYGFPDSAQRMVNLPDLQTTRLYFGNEEFSLFEGKVLDYRRTLDMDAGTVTRRVHWRSPNGKEALVSFTRMVSFIRKELFLTVISIEGVNLDCELKIVSEADCRVSNTYNECDARSTSECPRSIHMKSVEISGKAAVALCDTSASGLSVAAAMAHSTNAGAPCQTALTPNGFRMTMTLKPENGPVIINKFCVYSDSRRQKDCKRHALDVLNKAMEDGPEVLFAEQKSYLAEFWNASGVAIHGCDKAANSVAYGLYGLLQSAGFDEITSIPPKGLSGEGYDGHYFWDTEIYIFPFFLLTRPEHAKSLLNFRYSILGSARKHARILGHNSGALYSWRTITGSECSPHYPLGSSQYHINGDIAYAFLQYYNATKDLDFMAEKGAEVLIETARLWIDVGQYDRKGQLCFNGVTGPDAYACIVNNNYFTNLSAKHNLLGAISVCKALKEANRFDAVADKLKLAPDELEAFEKAANDIYIPYDEELDINPQDDSFCDKAKWDLEATPEEKFPLSMHYHPLYLYRHQVCKQADAVLAHYLYEDAADSTISKSYDYYEPITTHGSSLSACIFSIVASRLGRCEKAYEYFLSSSCTDLDDAHNNTKDGIHTASMGGTYLAVLMGFAGLRIKEDGFRFRFTLPEEWSGYAFHVTCAGSLLHVSVQSDEVKITLVKGEPVSIYVDDTQYVIRDTLSLKDALH